MFRAGDEHFWCWRWMCFTLEMNTLALETNMLRTCVWALATHTHTDSYQRLPSKNYSHSYLPLNGHYHVEEIQKLSRCTTSSVALNWSSRQTSAYSQLHAFSSPGVAWPYMPRPGIIEQKPKKLTNQHARHFWRQFQGRSSPVVASTTSQTSKGRCPVAEQLFDMCNIRTHYSFRVKLINKRKKTNKINIFTCGFLKLDKG